MLNGAILYSGVPDEFFNASLYSFRGVKWHFAAPSVDYPDDNLKDGLFLQNCNLAVILDPDFTSFAYLSELVRNGCHLFLTEKQKMSPDERMKLIHLAEEGSTLIQFRNDLLFHPSFLADNKNSTETKLVVLQHVAPQKHYLLQEMLYCNLLMTLKIIGAEPSRINVCSIPSSCEISDIVNLHLNFNNGSAASLTFSFTGRKHEHLVSIHSSKGTKSYNFDDKKRFQTSFNQLSEDKPIPDNWLLFRQINHFAESILKKNCQRNILSEEAKTFKLIEKINQKLELGPVLI